MRITNSSGEVLDETNDFLIYYTKFGNDVYNYIDVNEIKMWVSNNGDGSHSPLTDECGLFWPKEGDAWEKSAIFEDGLIYGGVTNGEIRVNGSTYRHGLQAGRILSNGMPDSVDKSEYTIWKVLKGWENLPQGYQKDYYEYMNNNWPVETGAPYVDVDGDGIYTPGIDHPEYTGDMVLFNVSNDMDTAHTTFMYGTDPMGLEFQTLVFGFDREDDLKNVVFKKYLMINKGSNNIEDMYLGYWSDPDLGDANDDFTGSDSLLDLSYTYNGTNFDNIYGSAPPALGYKIVQGPIAAGLPTDSAKFRGVWRRGFKNLKSNAFSIYLNMSNIYQDPDLGVSEGSIQFYNNLKGLSRDGQPYVDPNSNDTTKFCVPGDPYFHTGWYEGEGWPGGPSPDDRRHVMSIGPFNMAPGDTQEFVVAVCIARGSDNIHSVYKLKQLAQTVQDFYNNDYISQINYMEPAVIRYSLSQNYPNPFNPITNINYSVPDRQFVQMKVYDILGREVVTLVNEEKKAGNYSIQFDASRISSGVYFYQMKAGSYSVTKKLILLK